MLIGYARVSTDDQDTKAQIAALKAAGCGLIFEEKASGGRWDRPVLHEMLSHLREDDAVVVWKLDRLSRSLKDLLHVLEQIQGKGAGFQSLTESIDTLTPAGRMMMHMVGAFAEFERAMLRERTQAGLKEARKAGRIGGRRPKLTTGQQAEIVRLVESGEKTAADAARLFRVHRATVARIVERHRAEATPPPTPVKTLPAKKPTKAGQGAPAKKKAAKPAGKPKATKKAPTKATGRKASPAPKGMPNDWTLDAVGLARPPGFHDYPGAVQVHRHEDAKREGWKNRFEKSEMAAWEAAELVEAFHAKHDERVAVSYPYPDKTIRVIQAVYTGDDPDHRLVLTARNR